MGYDFHITRAEDWSDRSQARITSEEWLAVVRSDPELRLDPQNGHYFAIWIDTETGSDKGWFDWFDGDIFTKNPDVRLLAKMLALAARLHATVQGDDGEVYTSVEDHPACKEARMRAQRPWWRFW
jgi:hypothetical protein